MKLIAYKTYDYTCQHLVPASRTRDRMDQTPSSTKRQKNDVRGEDSLGEKYSQQPKTDWKTPSFVSKL